jgi:enoyl-CoA hydratase/carnithine racemase
MGPGNGSTFGLRCERISCAINLAFISPILSQRVLDSLISTLESAAHGDVAPLILTSDDPKVFLAGAHLGEIAALDTAGSVAYARRGRRVVELLERFPAPTIAAVHGPCSGGGFDLVLACDLVVAGTLACFSHPGIRRGLITGWSGTIRLPDALGGQAARAALLEARELDAGALLASDTVLFSVQDPLEGAIESARRLAAGDPEKWRLWRSLRGPGFVDRFRASVVHKL